MKEVLLILNIIFAILIVVFILMQGRGAGLGNAWGGGGEMFQTRRGVEKLTMRLTTICIVIFFILSVVNLFLK
jgi:preprotein translocase subunit SecG